MSPRSHRHPITHAAAAALNRMAHEAGATVRSERIRRALPLRDVAVRAGISAAHLQSLEAGEAGSLEAYARTFVALGLRPTLVAEAARAQRRPGEDSVHAAMGELQAGRLRGRGLQVALDEPYQHFQFAGRGDVVAWDLASRALLHIENRTQFPNVQEALGSYGAKRAYLPAVLADRLGLGRAGWAHVTHAIAALWSAEVVHILRLRRESFRTACPDPSDGFLQWWRGRPEQKPHGVTSTLVLMDPGDVRDRYRFAGLDEAKTVRPRYRDYAEAAKALKSP